MSAGSGKSSIVDSMGTNLITFNKTFDERLEEYKSILGTSLPASQVFDQWCEYLEISMEPTGWYAVWNISRELCEDFNIRFPTIVLVFVEIVNFKDLSANVLISGVLDDVQLPKHVFDVPLQNLYPTQEQENDVLNTHITAECLDQYRVFYNHLWWPWDTEEYGETSDWVLVNLDNRLRLYYDMLSGDMAYEIGEKIRHYIESGKKLYDSIKELEDLVCDEEDDNLKSEMTENEAMLLIKNAELDQIKNQLVLYENKDFRKIETRKKQKMRTSNKSSEVTIVMSSCSSQDAVKYLNEFQLHFPATNIFQFCSDPQEAVSKAFPGDSVIIAPGTFKLNSSGAIEEGGSIRGMLKNNKPILEDRVSKWSLLDFSGNAELSSLTIKISQVHSGIIVRRNCLSLKDVTMKAASSAFSQAIVVLKNATLEANNCTFNGFATAIVANEGAKVVMNSCIFENNNFAIKLCEGADVTLSDCQVFSSKNCAIQIQSGKQISQISSMDVLKTFPGVKAVGLTIQNSSRGDVQVVKKPNGISLCDNE